ncbi:MAG TPA: hypothetical protein VMG60_08700 [Burkholderiaceae bacterium]|nr:hypothetical protein [Burkholderiaceae bacterium]
MARILLDYALSIVFAMPVALFAQTAAKAEAPTTSNPPAGVGFKSVADALAALKTRPGAKISVTQPDAWTIITEQGGAVVWSFTPATHPAHPAVVRRAIVVGEDGLARIEMAGLCQAEKAPCDRLMKDFRDLTERSTRAMRERINSADETKQQ